jgi:hypothetical protein
MKLIMKGGDRLGKVLKQRVDVFRAKMWLFYMQQLACEAPWDAFVAGCSWCSRCEPYLCDVCEVMNLMMTALRGLWESCCVAPQQRRHGGRRRRQQQQQANNNLSRV